MLAVDDQRAAPLFRGVERNVGKDFFHDRVQPPRPDILGAGVHVFREGRDFPQAVIRELNTHTFGFKHGLVLSGQRIVRLGQDAVKFFLSKSLQFRTERETALQLGEQVGRLG